jgi:hypothetical protein
LSSGLSSLLHLLFVDGIVDSVNSDYPHNLQRQGRFNGFPEWIVIFGPVMEFHNLKYVYSFL